MHASANKGADHECPLAPKSLTDPPRVACHDHVCVPDGRVGEVIGFYRRDRHVAIEAAVRTPQKRARG